MKKRTRRIMTILLFFAAAVSFVRAEDACYKDRLLTCNDIHAGDGRVHDCLIGRRDKVAPACAQALDRADQLAAAAVSACTPEVQRWCAQYTGSGRGAILQCLKSHKDVVNDDCKRKYRQFKAFDFDIRS